MTAPRRPFASRPSAPATATRAASGKPSGHAAHAAFKPKLNRLALETRILFDGAGMAAAVDAGADDAEQEIVVKTTNGDKQDNDTLFTPQGDIKDISGVSDPAEGDTDKESGTKVSGEKDNDAEDDDAPSASINAGSNPDQPVGDALEGEDGTDTDNGGTVPVDEVASEADGADETNETIETDEEDEVVAAAGSGESEEGDDDVIESDSTLEDEIVSVTGADSSGGSDEFDESDDDIALGATTGNSPSSDIEGDEVDGSPDDGENESEAQAASEDDQEQGEEIGDLLDVELLGSEGELDQPAAITGLDDEEMMVPMGMMGIMSEDAPNPIVGIDLPDDGVMLGEDFTFTIEFENNGGTGYGPYVELYLPRGEDADESHDQVDEDDQDDGIHIADTGAITYLGQDVNYTIVTVGDEHPYARDNNGVPWEVGAGRGQAGQKVVIIELPFGSYTSDQPVASLQVKASVHEFADLDKPLEMTVVAGFRYGKTAVEDYATDPTIEGQSSTVTVQPQLIRYEHDFNHAEGETATGPNFERTMTTTITVADGQTVEDYELTVEVPDNVVLTGVTVNGTDLNPGQYSYDEATGIVVVNMGELSGKDNTVGIIYYIPEMVGGDPVLDPDYGQPGSVEFDVSGEGKGSIRFFVGEAV